MNHNDTNYIPLREAKKILYLSAPTFRTLAKNGSIKTITMSNGHLRFSKQSIYDYINSCNIVGKEEQDNKDQQQITKTSQTSDNIEAGDKAILERKIYDTIQSLTDLFRDYVSK